MAIVNEIMKHDQEIDLLIVRLLAGEAGEKEKRYIEDWLQQQPDNRKLFNDLREVWISAGYEKNATGYNVEEAISRFVGMIRAQRRDAGRLHKLIPILRYAAVFVLLAALPVFYYFGKQAATPPAAFTTISCPAGDKTSVVLPDGSEVWLNSESRLTFANNFPGGSRSLSLEGEAYFSVRHDAKNPFRVVAGEITVEVLGTEFNLKAYASDNAISATLVKGSVEVTGNNRRMAIKPGQKLTFDKAGGSMHLNQISDFATDTGWKDGRLIFRNQSLAELKPDLQRWFDVEIEFADQLVSTRRFSGIIERESILEVISFFGASRLVDYRIDGNVITFFTEKNR